MNYTVSGTNLNQNINSADNQTSTSINIKENKKSIGKTEINNAFAGVMLVDGNQKINSTSSNTYNELLKEADDVKSQIMQSASTAKLSLKALMMKLNGQEAVRIDEDGFNITDANEEDCVNIIEKIRIELAMHCEDYTAYGTGVDSSKIEEVAGYSGVSDEVMNKLQGVYDKAKDLKPLTEDTKNYLIDNNLKASVSNIYIAQSLGKTYDGSISDVEFDNVRAQVCEVIKRAGLEVNKANLDNARTFIANHIPVTEENLNYKAQLDSLDINKVLSDKESFFGKMLDNMAVGNNAEDTEIINRPTILDTVRQAVNTLNDADITDVDNVLTQEKTFNILSLKLSVDARLLRLDTLLEQDRASSEESINHSENVDKLYDTMIEARILMTADAGVFLVKNGVNILTTPLNELVNQLRGSRFCYSEDENINSQLIEAAKSIEEIRRSPLEIFNDIFSKPDGQSIITLGDISAKGSALSKSYDRARRDYEAVGTQVRRDLGDSLKKAVINSTDNLIEEIGLEGTKEDKDAIRILAANNMEMNRDNIDRVKEVNAVLNNIIENMKPETVLKMIREGINPLTADINDLNAYLVSMNSKAGADNEERFSKFLFKLDRTQGIGETERKQFIGIYQMMNLFTKDAGEAAGALVNQGNEVSLKNLLAAYNARKHAGMDETINDETGMAEIRGNANYYMALFDSSKKLITPNTLKNVDNIYGLGEQSVENFIDSLNQMYDVEVESELEKEYIRIKAEIADEEKNVLRQLRRADMDNSIGNIEAVKLFLMSGQFPKISKRNMIEKIGHREEIELEYEKMRDEVEQELQEAVSLSGDLNTELNVNYDEFMDLRIRSRQFAYLERLSQKHDYRIPYETEDGNVGMINLTLISDSEESGKISIKFSKETYGEMSVEAKVNSEEATLFVVADNKLNEGYEERLEELKDKLKATFRLNSVVVYKSTSSLVPFTTYENNDTVPTDRLYEMAGLIVKTLS